MAKGRFVAVRGRRDVARRSYMVRGARSIFSGAGAEGEKRSEGSRPSPGRASGGALRNRLLNRERLSYRRDEEGGQREEQKKPGVDHDAVRE